MFKKLAVVTFSLLLCACTTIDNGDNNASSSSAATASGSNAEQETRNVTYSGVVQPAGISIYQQGSHRLVLEDSRFILLESSTVDLNGYVDEEVDVFGSVRPTVEEGGMIMRVERVTLKNAASSSAAATTSSAAASSAATSAAPTPTPTPTPSTSSPSAQTSSPSSVDTADLEAQVALMMKDNLEPVRWTQQYCTGHIGFCAPVHKNWYFHSFGATTTTIWHVEVGTKPLDQIGGAPIAILLKSGSLTGHTDGQVVIEGNKVVGYRAWDDESHFELQADARLVDAVRYITAGLRKYEE